MGGRSKVYSAVSFLFFQFHLPLNESFELSQIFFGMICLFEKIHCAAGPTRHLVSPFQCTLCFFFVQLMWPTIPKNTNEAGKVANFKRNTGGYGCSHLSPGDISLSKKGGEMMIGGAFKQKSCECLCPYLYPRIDSCWHVVCVCWSVGVGSNRLSMFFWM